MLKYPEQLMFIKNSKAIQKTTNERMDGKLCVISGATSGVGYESCIALANAGANIVMVVRNEKKAKDIKQKLEQQYSVSVDYVISDFSDLSQVRTAANTILERYKRIDVLINSAGIHSTKKIITKEGHELVFCVNHLGTFLLTMLLLDRIKQSQPSRIIQVNSEGHRFNGLRLNDINWKKRLYTGLRSYGASKTAQLFTVWQLAKDLESTDVTINAIHPGAVKTNIGNNNGRLYRWFLHNVTWRFLKDPKISGEAIYYLAASKELDHVSGKFFNLTIEEKPAKHALDPKMQEKIWELSKKLCNLQ